MARPGMMFNDVHAGLAFAAMGDEGDHDLRSSIAVAHGCLFIRTGSKLYCVGQK